MEAALVNADTAFQKSDFGIEEPVDNNFIQPDEIDMVIVPLLICDKKGYRVGYGKGFYDKFLARCRPDCIPRNGRSGPPPHGKQREHYKAGRVHAG